MTPERIAELREMEAVFSVYAGFVIDNPTFRELLDEIERLERELAEARRDSERLDWFSVHYGGPKPAWHVDRWKWEYRCTNYDTLRAAIDAAKGEQG